jgi:regulator of extracellular matrix RemA (YlzA/DUF370 family)
MSEILALGYGSFVPLLRVAWIAPLGGSAIKRLRRAKEAEGKAVDVTQGHSATSVIGLDSSEIVISAVSAQALQKRLTKISGKAEE